MNDEDDADDDDYANDDVISWRNPPGILCGPRFCVVLFMVRYVIPDRLVVVLLFSAVFRDFGVVPRCSFAAMPSGMSRCSAEKDPALMHVHA